jgi:hypothetical protein
MTLSQKIGFASCILLIVSLFLNWAWYPDIEKYFSAFFSESNYYGKPGKLLSFFAIAGLFSYAYRKIWTQRLNLIFAALCMGYGLKTWLLFTSGYDGYVPTPQLGIYLMLIGCLGHLIGAMGIMTFVKRTAIETPEKLEEQQKIAIKD